MTLLAKPDSFITIFRQIFMEKQKKKIRKEVDGLLYLNTRQEIWRECSCNAQGVVVEHGKTQACSFY